MGIVTIYLPLLLDKKEKSPYNYTHNITGDTPMKDSIKLNYIPRHVDLNGLMFAQTGHEDGEQSVGKVDGAAFAIGKAHTGEEIKVYFNIDPVHVDAQKRDKSKTFPKVGEGADKPKLAILEQLTKIEGSENEYEAKWRSVLQSKKRDLMPFWGVGRLEVDLDSPERWNDDVNQLLLQLKEVKMDAEMSDNPLAAESQIHAIEDQILEARDKFKIRAIYALHHEMHENVSPDTDSVDAVLSEILEKYCVDGIKAGAIIRVRRGDKVVANLCSEVRRLEDYSMMGKVKNLPPKPLETAIEEFYKYGSGNYILSAVKKDSELTLDIIPEVIIAGGPLTNSKYKKDPAEYRKLISTYYDHNDPTKAVARFMAVRLNENVERDEDDEIEGNYLLTAAHSISAAMGSFLEMDSTYQLAYDIDFTDVDFKRIERNASKRSLGMGSNVPVPEKKQAKA